MSTPSSPTPPTAQSPLSEAVEQASESVNCLYEDVESFSKHQADRLSSGTYGLDDLVGGGFDAVRLGVKHATAASMTIMNNIALLAAPPPDPAHVHDPPSGELKVAVTVPAPTALATGAAGFTSSALLGRRHGYRVPATSITVQPEPVPAAAVAPATSQVLILAINFGGAPNDIYDGAVQSPAPAVSTPFMVPLAEFGVAGSAPEVTDIL